MVPVPSACDICTILLADLFRFFTVFGTILEMLIWCQRWPYDWGFDWATRWHSLFQSQAVTRTAVAWVLFWASLSSWMANLLEKLSFSTDWYKFSIFLCFSPCPFPFLSNSLPTPCRWCEASPQHDAGTVILYVGMCFSMHGQCCVYATQCFEFLPSSIFLKSCDHKAFSHKLLSRSLTESRWALRWFSFSFSFKWLP